MAGNTPDRKLLKQVNGLGYRVSNVLLGTDLVAGEVTSLPVAQLGEITKEAGDLIVARIRGLEPGEVANSLLRKADGSISLKRVVRGRTDEELVAGFKKAGWGYVNTLIRSDRRMTVKGKPKIKAGTEKTLTIKSVVPEGQAWKFSKAVKAVGNTALAFDLEDLTDLVLPHRDELLKLGVKYVIAPAARFRGVNGNECVVYASLEYRKLYLYWVGDDWYSVDWFGSSK